MRAGIHCLSMRSIALITALPFLQNRAHQSVFFNIDSISFTSDVFNAKPLLNRALLGQFAKNVSGLLSEQISQQSNGGSDRLTTWTY